MLERYAQPPRGVRRCAAYARGTPSSAASASRGHSRLGSSRAAKARALATHGSGTARRPESQVRYVSAATPNTAANSVWDRCSCSRSARISHKGPVGAVRSFHRYCVLNTLPVERIAFVERSHVRLQLQKSFVQATRHYLRKREHLEMSYEALATSPWREVARAVEWLGLDFEPGQMDWAGKEHHHIQGNHLRRDRDGRISLDRRWETGLNAWQKLYVRTLTLPTLLFPGAR